MPVPTKLSIRPDDTPLPIIGRNMSVEGTIAALSQEVNLILPDGTASVAVQIRGTWSGILTPQGTIDGATYVSIMATDGSASRTANTVFFLETAGYKAIRIVASSTWTSGVAVIMMIATPAPSNRVLPIEAEGDTAVSGEFGIPALGYLAGAPSEWSYFKMDSDGALLVNASGISGNSLGKLEDAAHASGDAGVMDLTVRQNTAAALSGTDGAYQPLITDTNGRLHVIASSGIAGDIAHDAADSGNPLKIVAKAVAHGANPTAVAAADRTDLYANRHGILFVIGGHPNIVTLRVNYTAAQTNAAIVTIAGGLKIVVTRISA